MNIMHRKVARSMADVLRRSSTRWLSVQCCGENENSVTMKQHILAQQFPGNHLRGFCTVHSDPIGAALIDVVTYETVCSDTLEGLCEYFEQLVESTSHLKSGDVFYSDGVLTVKLGDKYGTYVINRQSPNRQIWLSSPTSGPKRYDFVSGGKNKDGKWIYKHDGRSLHELLQKEIREIVQRDVDFFNLPHSGSPRE
ncbi:frataxin homolog, mitochondrial [Phlebotomus argentipes]|uniref:frataxin homolog, mitochondrial n=1 Tax=Phlebotomus argentipes TaxID=94469 RepID=UPI002892BBE8|nr:frataxin homolog, mitochondrial [Phlebotomus argentipes]XP_059609584.1 frataxin homolog, mitochondrial [Phlebotomus argentipes]XP_059609585.1 frataxin homolog, mitochondrial [Phlebotomus argentipes]